MSIFHKLKEQLIKHEGLELEPYLDSVGVLTIGVGRNLQDNGISYDEAIFMLENDIKRALEEIKSSFEWFEELNEVRQIVIANMVFNLGITRFSGFERTIEAIEEEDFTEAAREMMDSLWARQVGKRARQLAVMMESGELQEGFH